MSSASSKKESYLFGRDETGAEFRVNAKDRKAHMHVIGASGKGKSKFLERLIRQDLKNRKVGACVIDPHGALVDDIMDYVAHKAPHLASRIILFEPAAQTDQITGFNPIPRDYDSLPNAVDGIIESILFAWGQGEEAFPRLKSWLYNVLYPVLANKLTLVEALPMISLYAKAERQALLSGVSSMQVRSAWDSFETLSSTEKLKMLEGVQNRLFRLLNSEHMRLVLSQQENALDFASIMSERKIVLVSLRNYGRVHPANLRMLGIMLLSEIYRVGMQRNERRDNPPFHMYVDEFGQYVTPVVAAALDEIRKKNIFFTVAHQHLAQLENDEMGKQILNSVMTNCRLKVAFGGLTPYDADQISKLIWTGKYDLKQEKHNTWVTKVRTKESTRTSISEGHTVADGITHTDSEGTNYSDGVSDGYSDGETQTHTESEQEGWNTANAHGQTQNSTWNRGQNSGNNWGKSNSQADSYGTSQSKNASHSYGTSKNDSVTHGTSETESEADTYGVSRSRSNNYSYSSGRTNSESQNQGKNTQYIPDGVGTTTAIHSDSGGQTVANAFSESSTSSSGESESESRSKTKSNSHTKNESATTGSGSNTNDTKGFSSGANYTDTKTSGSNWGGSSSTSASRGGGQGKSQVHSEGHSGGTGYADARGQSHTNTHTQSHSTGGSQGTSDSVSHSKAVSRSKTTAPYDEKEEYQEISSTTFWSLPELQAMQQGDLMTLPTGIALFNNEGGTPAYIKIPYVKPIAITERSSAKKLAQTKIRLQTANPRYYAPKLTIEQEAHNRQIPFFGEPLQLNEMDLEAMPLIEDDGDTDGLFNV